MGYHTLSVSDSSRFLPDDDDAHLLSHPTFFLLFVSAGSISVCLHLVSSLSVGLFHRAILESGGCDSSNRTLTTAEAQGEDFANTTALIPGFQTCGGAAGVVSQIACFRSDMLTAEIIVGVANAIDAYDFLLDDKPFLPNVDGVVFTEHPRSLFHSGHYQRVPLLIGSNLKEVSVFLFPLTEDSQFPKASSKSVRNYANTKSKNDSKIEQFYTNGVIHGTFRNEWETFESLLSKSIFQCPTRRVARIMSNHTQTHPPVFAYAFNYSASGFYDKYTSVSGGAFHASELPLVLGCAEVIDQAEMTDAEIEPNTTAHWTSRADELVSIMMRTYWSRFILTGDVNSNVTLSGLPSLPDNLTTPIWTPYDINQDNTLFFGYNGASDVRMSTGVYADECAMWDPLIVDLPPFEAYLVEATSTHLKPFTSPSWFETAMVIVGVIWLFVPVVCHWALWLIGKFLGLHKRPPFEVPLSPLAGGTLSPGGSVDMTKFELGSPGFFDQLKVTSATASLTTPTNGATAPAPAPTATPPPEGANATETNNAAYQAQTNSIVNRKHRRMGTVLRSKTARQQADKLVYAFHRLSYWPVAVEATGEFKSDSSTRMPGVFPSRRGSVVSGGSFVSRTSRLFGFGSRRPTTADMAQPHSGPEFHDDTADDGLSKLHVHSVLSTPMYSPMPSPMLDPATINMSAIHMQPLQLRGSTPSPAPSPTSKIEHHNLTILQHVSRGGVIDDATGGAPSRPHANSVSFSPLVVPLGASPRSHSPSPMALSMPRMSIDHHDLRSASPMPDRDSPPLTTIIDTDEGDSPQLHSTLPDSTLAALSSCLLKSVSGTFSTGELYAVMGGSGSGKSTLLELLTLRREAGMISGDVLINGQDVTTCLPWLSECMGFVSQFGSPALPELTVRENLVYAAMLRLDADLSVDAKLRRVDEVISMCGLEGVQNVAVGSESMVGGISGGQFRRLSVALELLAKPRFLVCDEATSGLDAASAMELMLVLYNYVREGNCVIISIHQPRREIWNLFSQVVLVDHGRIIYQGPPASALDTMTQAIAEAQMPNRLKRGLDRGMARAASGAMNTADFILDALRHNQVGDAMWSRYAKVSQPDTIASIQAEIDRHNCFNELLRLAPNDSTVCANLPVHIKTQRVWSVRQRDLHQPTAVIRRWATRLFALETRRMLALPWGMLVKMPIIWTILGILLPLLFFRRMRFALSLGGWFSILINCGIQLGLSHITAIFFYAIPTYEKEVMVGCVTAAQHNISMYLHVSGTVFMATFLAWIPGLCISAVPEALTATELMLQLLLLSLCFNVATLCYMTIVSRMRNKWNLDNTATLSSMALTFSTLFTGFMILIQDIPVGMTWALYINPLYWTFGAVMKLRLDGIIRYIPGQAEDAMTMNVVEIYHLPEIDVYGHMLILLCMQLVFCFLAWLFLDAPWQRHQPIRMEFNALALAQAESYAKQVDRERRLARHEQEREVERVIGELREAARQDQQQQQANQNAGADVTTGNEPSPVRITHFNTDAPYVHTPHSIILRGPSDVDADSSPSPKLSIFVSPASAPVSPVESESPSPPLLTQHAIELTDIRTPHTPRHTNGVITHTHTPVVDSLGAAPSNAVAAVIRASPTAASVTPPVAAAQPQWPVGTVTGTGTGIGGIQIIDDDEEYEDDEYELQVTPDTDHDTEHDTQTTL